MQLEIGNPTLSDLSSDEVETHIALMESYDSISAIIEEYEKDHPKFRYAILKEGVVYVNHNVLPSLLELVDGMADAYSEAGRTDIEQILAEVMIHILTFAELAKEKAKEI